MKRAILCLVVIVASGGCREDSSPAQVARRLVHSPKSPDITEAVRLGDAVLEPVRLETGGFSNFDDNIAVNAVVELLTRTKTEAAQRVVDELLLREDPLPWLIGVASRPEMPLQADHVGRLVRYVAGTFSAPESRHMRSADGKINEGRVITCRGLAIDAVTRRRIGEAYDALVKIVASDDEYAHHHDACEALAAIGRADAVPPLRDALARDGFDAPGDALIALSALGDQERGVELAMQRLKKTTGDRRDELQREVDRIKKQMGT